MPSSVCVAFFGGGGWLVGEGERCTVIRGIVCLCHCVYRLRMFGNYLGQVFDIGLQRMVELRSPHAAQATNKTPWPVDLYL